MQSQHIDRNLVIVHDENGFAGRGRPVRSEILMLILGDSKTLGSRINHGISS
jgi:hypothetical protein